MKPNSTPRQRAPYITSRRISTAAMEAKIGLLYMIAMTSASGKYETAAKTQ